MNLSESFHVSTEYLHAQLVIAQSHEDIEARARARNRLLAALMPKLLHLCRSKVRRFGPSENEMMSEAVTAALDCIRVVDTQKAASFLAYVMKRARFRIMDLMGRRAESRPVPLRIARRLKRIADECGDRTSVALLSNREIASRFGLRVGSVKAIKLLIPDRANSGNELCVAADDLQDTGCNSPAQMTETIDWLRTVAQIVSAEVESLPPRQRQVLLMAFPLDRTQPKTQTEIGAELGISSQRVQRIIAAALRRLKAAISGHAALRVEGI